MTDPDDSSMDYKVVPTPHLGHCHFDFDSHAHHVSPFCSTYNKIDYSHFKVELEKANLFSISYFFHYKYSFGRNMDTPHSHLKNYWS